MTASADPQRRGLARKVEVVRDPSFSTIAAAVNITTADGKMHRSFDEGRARQRCQSDERQRPRR